jgi:indolepyruvate ferredoxin oxidoreductase beta subunit
MNQINNILLAGVGGQGILLASEVLSEAMMLSGFDVKKNEVHGMSQRGGSVVSHVRWGDKVYSPIIPEGEVDILFSFELLETQRYLPLLRKNGRILVNNLKIAPPAVALGKMLYPSDLIASLKAQYPDTIVVDGLDLALEIGNPKTVNTILLGTLSNILDLDKSIWLEALRKMIPERLLEINLKAFEVGCRIK